MNQLSERGNIHYGKEGDIDKAEDNIILKSEPAESTNEKKNDTLVMMAHCVTEEEKRKDKSKRARIVRLEENHIHDDGQIENDKEGEDKKRLMAHVVEKEEEKKGNPVIAKNDGEKVDGLEISGNASFKDIVKEENSNYRTTLTDHEMLALLQSKSKVNIPSEPQTNRQNLKYEERLDGLYVGGKCIANCTVSIKSMQTLERENGFQINKFICLIKTLHECIEVSVPVEEFRDGRWLRRCPYVIFRCQKNKVYDFFFTYLNSKIEEDRYGIDRIFETPGWKTIDGRMLYVTPNGVIGSNIGLKSLRGSAWYLRAPQLNEKGRFEQFLRMRFLTPQTPIATILQLYTLQSFMYTLYLHASAVPKFCIFLEGPKGTHKTSLALTMTQTGDVKAPKYTFTASTAGLEAGFADYHDAVMLVDDLMPVESIKTRKLIEGNLEFLTRLFGDATGKMRNLDFCDNSGMGQYRTYGGCVFTGEYYIGCGSSLARTIKLHCKAGDIDTGMLTEYQQNPEILDEFLVSFISYITGRFGELVAFVAKYFDEKRRYMYKNFSNPRYAEYFAQLTCCAEILTFYGRDKGYISEQDRIDVVNLYKESIIQVLQNNDANLRDEEPVVKVAKALFEAYENRDVNKRLGLNFLQDEKYYHISEAELLQCYTYFIHRYGIEEISSKAKRLVNLLANVGAVEAAMEGGTKRYATKMSGYGNKRFLHIKKDLIFTLAGEKKEAVI